MPKESTVATPEVIAELKARYPETRLYKKAIPDGGDDYIFRSLTYQDWKAILAWTNDNPNLKASDIDEKIVETCLLWPLYTGAEADVRRATQPAGVVSSLSLFIRQKSGFIIPEIPGGNLFVEDLVAPPPAARPSDEEVAALKSATPHRLYYAAIEGVGLVFRPITRQEWRAVTADPAADVDLLTVSKCVHWPKAIDWDRELAGIVQTIAGLIVEKSGFQVQGDVEEL